MKIRNLFFIGLITLLIFLIYLTTVDRKIYYVNIGDSVAMGVNSYKISNNGYDNYINKYLNKEDKLEKYINKFNKYDLRITDLYNMINNNYEIKEGNYKQSIKNALIKADIITLAIGHDYIYQKINTNYTLNELYDLVDKYINDMERLLVLIKKYCKEDIIVIGYYIPYDNQKSEETITYMNKKMNDLTKELQVKYINIQNIINSNHLIVPNDYHISNNGYQLISNEILKTIKKEIL